ncbi:thioredoxin family protein [Akkermansia muciniphila]|uniref:thioredoxin family protein n=1 Tax=Akkermansia muciniphila TaxID=239935 RepID=UPI0033A23AB2
MSLPRLSMLLFVSAALCSCVGTSPESGKPKVKKSLSEYMQDNMANSIANVPTGLLGTTPGQQQAHQLTASTQEEMTRTDSGAVYYTDAHDPEAPIPGLDEAFAQRKENERWIQSYPSALREAQSTGKPILIWFHHSAGSPPSRKLAAELLHTKEFEDWAKNNVVRVCYDQAEKFESEPIFKKRRKMLEYVQKAPSLFGVRGTPVLLVMSPDGTKVDTIRGYYTGQNALYFDQIKNSVKLAGQQYEEFKKTLIPKGYRVWTGLNGNTVFAKLSRYSEKDQALWLQELDGHQSRTSLQKISPQDRKWLLEQKKAHENSRRNGRHAP